MTSLTELFPSVLITSRDAAIMALAMALILVVARRLPPVWKHLLWMAVVIRLLLPVLPESTFSWRHWVSQPQEDVVIEPGMSLFPERVGPGGPYDFLGIPVVKSSIHLPAIPSLPTSHEAPKPTLSEILPQIWALGAVVLLGLTGFGWLRFQRRIRRYERARHPQLPALRAMLAQLAGEQGIRRVTRLVLTDAVEGPALCGWWRPRLLLPGSTMESLSPDQIRLVMLHELGHLRRQDVLVNWLLSLLQAIHWFNPFVWWAFRKIRVEAERATDAWVLRRRGDSSTADYGETLIRLLESVRGGSRGVPGWVGVLESKTSLRSRLLAIRAYRGPSSPWLAAAAVVLLLGLGMVGLTQPPKKNIIGKAVAASPASPADATGFAGATQVQLMVKVWQEHDKAPDQLLASPVSVALLDEWMRFEERHHFRHPTAYGLPGLPESLAAKASGGGTIGSSGDEPAWETHQSDVILPPHPEHFTDASVGWVLQLQPTRAADGTIQVVCVVEQTGLKGFANRGRPVTMKQAGGLLKKEKAVVIAENRQLHPVFLQRTQELRYVPDGRAWLPRVVSDTGVSSTEAQEEDLARFVSDFAEYLCSEELPRLRVEVEVHPVPETVPVEVPADMLSDAEKLQIYVAPAWFEIRRDHEVWLRSIMPTPPIHHDSQFPTWIREMSQINDVDLLSMPSALMRSGSIQRLEITREFIYPVTYDPPKSALLESEEADPAPLSAASAAQPSRFEKANTGVECQIKATHLEGDLIELDVTTGLPGFIEFLDFGAPVYRVEDGNPTNDIVSDNRMEMPLFVSSTQQMKARIRSGHTMHLGGFVRHYDRRVEDRLMGLNWVANSKIQRDQSFAHLFLKAELMDDQGLPLKVP